MPLLSIAAAARRCHVDRRTLQRAIRRGRLHLDAQHCLSTDELELAGYLLPDTVEPPPLVPPLDTPLLPILTQLLEEVAALVVEVRRLSAALSQGMPQITPQDTPLAAPHAYGEVPTRVLALLPQHQPATAAQLAHALGDHTEAGTKRVWQALQRLVGQGLVVREGRRYRLP